MVMGVWLSVVGITPPRQECRGYRKTEGVPRPHGLHPERNVRAIELKSNNEIATGRQVGPRDDNISERAPRDDGMRPVRKLLVACRLMKDGGGDTIRKNLPVES